MTAKELFEGMGITTSRELADKTGLSRQRTHQIWQGRGRIGHRHAEIISKAVGINRALLLTVECHPYHTDHKAKRKRVNGS